MTVDVAERDETRINPVAASSDALAPPQELERFIQAVEHCPCCGEPAILYPRISCKECGHELPMRCQIYSENGKYYGECLTLDLMTQGDTREEAIRRLQVAMFSYIATVLRDGTSPAGLIPRRSPWRSWVRYYASTVVDRLRYLVSGKPSRKIAAVPLNITEQLKIAHCS